MLNYQTILIEGLGANTSASLKKHISFSSLNPNAVATLAILLGWMNILSFIEYGKKISLLLGVLLMFIPIGVFARASSIGLLTSIVIFILFQKNKTIKVYFLYLLIAMILVGLFFYFVDFELLNTALDVDISTGKGFSNRYHLWSEGLELIQESPFFGYGFGTENGVYIEEFNGHMAHQVFLHYAIELGIINMLLFVLSIFYLLGNRIRRYYKKNNTIYLLQVSILSTFFIADFAGQLLYFNKYAFLVYALSSFYVTKGNKYV
jgi:O-antigen ligase